jgi:hypothetical protein
MFRQIELATLQVEAILQDFVLRGELQPRGPLISYLNDRNWEFLLVKNAVFSALAADRRVGEMKQATCVINKRHVAALCLLDEGEAGGVQLPVDSRPVVFYVAQFAVQGQLHVRADAPDEDVLDELHDFFPVTQAAIFPIQPLAASPSRQVPLLLIGRPLIQAYQVARGQAGASQPAQDTT